MADQEQAPAIDSSVYKRVTGQSPDGRSAAAPAEGDEPQRQVGPPPGISAEAPKAPKKPSIIAELLRNWGLQQVKKDAMYYIGLGIGKLYKEARGGSSSSAVSAPDYSKAKTGPDVPLEKTVGQQVTGVTADRSNAAEAVAAAANAQPESPPVAGDGGSDASGLQRDRKRANAGRTFGK